MAVLSRSNVAVNSVLCAIASPSIKDIQAIADKYGPPIAAATFKSGFDIEHINVRGDFAQVISHFDVEMTDKVTGDTGGGAGRLAGSQLPATQGWPLKNDA